MVYVLQHFMHVWQSAREAPMAVSERVSKESERGTY